MMFNCTSFSFVKTSRERRNFGHSARLAIDFSLAMTPFKTGEENGAMVDSAQIVRFGFPEAGLAAFEMELNAIAVLPGLAADGINLTSVGGRHPDAAGSRARSTVSAEADSRNPVCW